MLNMYNKKVIPTEARDKISKLVYQLKQEGTLEKYDINITFGIERVNSWGNPLSPDDVACSLSICMKMGESLFGDLKPTDMVYNIYCCVNVHSESIDLAIAHEIGSILLYISNFNNEMFMASNINETGKYMEAYKLVKELYADYYSHKLINIIDNKHIRRETTRIYETMVKLIESSKSPSGAIDLLLRVNTGAFGLLYNLCDWISTIYLSSHSARLLINEGYGESLIMFENSVRSLLNQLEHSNVIDIEQLYDLAILIQEIKVIYDELV